jgi:hypothetical protein
MRVISDGVFLPNLTFSTTAPTGLTYGSRDGRYTKIGSLVQFYAKIVLTSKGASGVGELMISLPFPAAKPGAFALGKLLAVSFPTDREQLVCTVAPNVQVAKILGIDSAGAAATAVTWAEIDNATEIEVSGSYYLKD